MLYSVFFVLALVTFIVGMYEARKQYKKKRIVTFKPIHIAVGGVFLSSTFIFIPIYWGIFDGFSGRVVKTILISFHNAIRLFIVDGEFDIVKDNVQASGALATAYSVLAAVLFVIAPALTFGLILSLLKNFYAHMILWLWNTGKKDIYVFSEMNEKSIALARSLKKDNPDIKVVFTDVYENDSEEYSELASSARELRAIFFRTDIENLNYSSDSKRKLVFFFIGEDENENLRQTLNLIDRCRDREGTEMYVFTSAIESQLLLQNADKGKIKLRRVDISHALINKYLHEEGEIIFDHARETASGIREIRAVVIGLDKFGDEMFRNLSWFCQMNGYKLYMEVYDNDPMAEEHLKARCPELLDEVHNGKEIPGDDAFYDITVHSGCDYETEAFGKSLCEFMPTFVFISLGEDGANTMLSAKVRMLCERAGLKPDIVSICSNSRANQSLRGIHNFKGELYNIDFIGALEDMYSGTSIIGSDLEEDALKRHLNSGAKDATEYTFWNYEYNYKSSISVSIHAKMTAHCDIPGASKTKDEQTIEERDIVERLEHRRWNAYMRSEGYIYNPIRNDLAKTHSKLIPFDALADEDKRKDSRVASKQ